MEFKFYYLYLFFTIVVVYSCSSDDKDNFDPIAQALIDDEVLVEFLQSHYFTPEKEIDTILNGETPLYDIVETDAILYNDINYKMYYYVDIEGVGKSPSRNDSIHILYRGFTLDSIKFDENTSYNSLTKSWLELPNLIPGWRYGMPHYKEGEKVIYPDESFGYENTGSGFFFMPSGLAYDNNSTNALANQPIYFFIELGAVVISDSDNDGVVNNDEDVDGDGDVLNDDTDEDFIPNYADIDDDNDRVRTIDEDVNGDGNPMNDDTDSDGTANYLDDDDDGDGKKTIDEDANNNGDPTDDDANEDGIPDYLDKDN